MKSQVWAQLEAVSGDPACAVPASVLERTGFGTAAPAAALPCERRDGALGGFGGIGVETFAPPPHPPAFAAGRCSPGRFSLAAPYRRAAGSAPVITFAGFSSFFPPKKTSPGARPDRAPRPPAPPALPPPIFFLPQRAPPPWAQGAPGDPSPKSSRGADIENRPGFPLRDPTTAPPARGAPGGRTAARSGAAGLRGGGPDPLPPCHRPRQGGRELGIPPVLNEIPAPHGSPHPRVLPARAGGTGRLRAAGR